MYEHMPIISQIPDPGFFFCPPVKMLFLIVETLLWTVLYTGTFVYFNGNNH